MIPTLHALEIVPLVYRYVHDKQCNEQGTGLVTTTITAAARSQSVITLEEEVKK